MMTWQAGNPLRDGVQLTTSCGISLRSRTASATLVVGPLSFVGLLAPHMAKLMGLVRARWHLLGAAVSGALLMVSADWIGQQILFPQEVPVGLVSTLLGGAYFMWCLRRL